MTDSNNGLQPRQQIWAVDLNQTISATPALMKAIMKGLRDDGCCVVILTGSQVPEVTDEVVQEKLAQIKELGLEKGVHYDDAVAVSGPEKKVARNKVQWMQHHNAVGLIDDRKKNIKAAVKAGFLGLRHYDSKGPK